MFIGGARHGENEILMLAIPFSLWAIVWTEKFNISGRLFK
jgi:spore maturation protein SpmB